MDMAGIFFKQYDEIKYMHSVMHTSFEQKLQSFILSIKTNEIDVNSHDSDGNIAIQYVIIHSRSFEQEPYQIDIFKILLLSTAAIDHQNKNGKTAIEMAFELNKHNLLELLIIHRGTDNNYVDSNGNTFLHLAVLFRKFGLLELLLTVQLIDTEVTNNAGVTALRIAINMGATNFIDKLLEEGAEFDYEEEFVVSYINSVAAVESSTTTLRIAKLMYYLAKRHRDYLHDILIFPQYKMYKLYVIESIQMIDTYLDNKLSYFSFLHDHPENVVENLVELKISVEYLESCKKEVKALFPLFSKILTRQFEVQIHHLKCKLANK